MNLSSPISEIPKLNKPQVAAFKKLGIETARDLLMFLPFRYLDFSKTAKISGLKAGENISLEAKVKSISSRFSFRGQVSLAEAIVSDETGSIKVVWFNQPYLAKSLKPGDAIFLAGQPDYYNFTLQLTNPIYEKVSDFPVQTSRLVPVYHLTKNLYPKTIRNAVRDVLPLANSIKDILPGNIARSQGLMAISEAIQLRHFPKNLEDILKSQQRFNFEEIFLNQLLIQKQKIQLAKKGAFAIKFNQKLVKKFVDSLPFKLTDEQRRAAWDILQDLEKPLPMNRLLEGDVGSGKTLVALIAALEAISNDFQVALLAPTEILAKQHFETAKKYLTAYKTHGRELYKPSLLTSSYVQVGEKEIKKAKLQALISEGMPGLYIGTHALLENKVKFKKLGLVIIDEQHRFGVKQRATLMHGSTKVPHLVSLTATPIPRTLKLALVGELDISIIRQKPAGRKTIETRLFNNLSRKKAYQFIETQIKNGRQAFVITPLIDENPASENKSAKNELENLRKIFPELSIGMLHGKMKSKEKETVMGDFLSNKIQILVSTSVVEVGVDVPNASAMVIEGAEHFGLSQLHQFRGRVGRADYQSYCFLFTSSNEPTQEITNRLEAFCKIQSGFDLAELDLKIRGSGQLFGQEQSGFDYKLFDPAYLNLIPSARQEAKKLLLDDLNLSNYPLLQAKIKDRLVHFE